MTKSLLPDRICPRCSGTTWYVSPIKGTPRTQYNCAACKAKANTEQRLRHKRPIKDTAPAERHDRRATRYARYLSGEQPYLCKVCGGTELSRQGQCLSCQTAQRRSADYKAQQAARYARYLSGEQPFKCTRCGGSSMNKQGTCLTCRQQQSHSAYLRQKEELQRLRAAVATHQS